eukprot:CAMPEP_0182425940 /NCGR_PEP_ID=MMETSP1167-20130531/12430_1 /TAXON_ID=2988 /ORGANISM="Mallomonas Sp, Strain CCMP3275" /LENGTH=305 /DNA_ID=CAMNT_0024607041 /DNA_START=271 /DNA_END=1188 /DNA_ORIENTATION=+
MEGVLVDDSSKRWTRSYVIGLISTGVISSVLLPKLEASESITFSTASLVVSGLLVGFGTKMGNGCTSGHGICGLSRLSLRSLAAVGTFMSSGAVSAYLFHEARVLNLDFLNHLNITSYVSQKTVIIGSIATVLLTNYCRDIYDYVTRKKSLSVSWSEIKDHMISFFSGTIFGIGLAYSGMSDPARVINFLNFTGAKGWDPTLMAVMGGAVGLKTLVNTLVVTQPTLQKSESFRTYTKNLKYGLHPSNLAFDFKLIFGSAMFGVGWGMGGTCPGPGMVALGAGNQNSLIFVPSMMIGMLLYMSLNK